MEEYLLKNVVIADPQSGHNRKSRDIFIRNGLIREIGAPGSLSSGKATVISAKGLHVSPGWVDMCVHLADPGYEWKEKLSALSQAAVTGGFTSILCYPNTLPVIDNGQMLHALQERTRPFPVDFMFAGALTAGTSGKDLAELYDMHLAGAKAFTDGTHPVRAAGVMLRALQYSQSFEGLIISLPEDQSISSGGQMNEGIQSTLLGLKGIPELAEFLAMERDLLLLSYAHARLHFQPLSSPEAVKRLKAAKRHFQGLSAGTAAYYLALDDKALAEFDSNLKVFPPLRHIREVRKLRRYVTDGTIDVICSGHQAQSIEEKNVEFELAAPGILGLQTTFSIAYQELVEKGTLSLGDLIAKLAVNPRKILRMPEVRIETGEPATLSLFQPEARWTFSRSQCYSRSSNSPFLGKELQGKVFGILNKGTFIQTA
jgi:dihydroorotase